MTCLQRKRLLSVFSRVLVSSMPGSGVDSQFRLNAYRCCASASLIPVRFGSVNSVNWVFGENVTRCFRWEIGSTSFCDATRDLFLLEFVKGFLKIQLPLESCWSCDELFLPRKERKRPPRD